VFLGTSGWSYKEWIGPFYSKEDKSMLKAYAKVFKTAEIDSTFYRYPSKGMVMGWTRYTPTDFVFTAKLPQLITHEKLLNLNQGVEQDLAKFVELLEPLWLGGKLGCLLIQLPPKLDYRPNLMEDFFKTLPTQIKFAVEFRNLSWVRPETWMLLAKYKVAYAIVDEPLLPSEVHLTSDFAYFRWHGRGDRPWFDYRYKSLELEPWIPKVRDVATKSQSVFGYFNNHFHGYAVENCLQVLEMLGVETPEQANAKSKIEAHFKKLGAVKEVKLEAFVEPKTKGFEELLAFLVAPARLERARSIGDEELRIIRDDADGVEATIREYRIVIDLANRGIRHDCADWSKIAPTKKLCKHVGKLLLGLDREKAMVILSDLHENLGSWRFELLSKVDTQ
jgi:uncharacterized protein YecE (DUF72 family)